MSVPAYLQLLTQEYSLTKSTYGNGVDPSYPHPASEFMSETVRRNRRSGRVYDMSVEIIHNGITWNSQRHYKYFGGETNDAEILGRFFPDTCNFHIFVLKVLTRSSKDSHVTFRTDTRSYNVQMHILVSGVLIPINVVRENLVTILAQFRPHETIKMGVAIYPTVCGDPLSDKAYLDIAAKHMKWNEPVLDSFERTTYNNPVFEANSTKGYSVRIKAHKSVQGKKDKKNQSSTTEANLNEDDMLQEIRGKTALHARLESNPFSAASIHHALGMRRDQQLQLVHLTQRRDPGPNMAAFFIESENPPIATFYNTDATGAVFYQRTLDLSDHAEAQRGYWYPIIQDNLPFLQPQMAHGFVFCSGFLKCENKTCAFFQYP